MYTTSFLLLNRLLRFSLNKILRMSSPERFICNDFPGKCTIKAISRRGGWLGFLLKLSSGEYPDSFFYDLNLFLDIFFFISTKGLTFFPIMSVSSKETHGKMIQRYNVRK